MDTMPTRASTKAANIERIHQELIDAVIGGQTPGVVRTCLVPGAIYLALTLMHATTTRPALAAICLAIAVTGVLRIGLSYVYRRAARRPGGARLWGWVFAAATTAGGLAWGALLSPAVSFVDDGYRLAIGTVLAVVSASALVSLAPFFPALAGFAIAALTPGSLSLLAGGQPQQQLVGLVQCGLLLVTLATGYSAGRKHRQVVALQLENENLIAEREHAWRAAEAAGEAKSRFLATISHEVRTPLTGIMGTAEQLSAMPLPPALARQVQTIVNSCDMLVAIVNDVLDLANIEADHLELCEDDFDPARTAQEVVDLLRAPARAKGLELSLSVAPGVPFRVRGDRVRVSQILLNLVGNAIECTPSGSVRVAINGPEPVSSGDSMTSGVSFLRFEVRDSGAGISSDDQARIFGSSPQSATRPDTGTVLGLAFAKRLAELHGGAVEVHSTPGVGSTFCCTIKVGRPSFRRAAAETHRSEPLVHDPLSGRVLVAEDNAVNRELAVTLLRSFGLEVDAVGDGDLALEKVMVTPYDAVLLDCRLPKTDGIATATRIRELGRTAGFERLAKLPLIAFTADVTEESRAAWLLAGIDDWIVKPFHQRDVLRTLAHWLGHTPPPQTVDRDTIVEAANLFRARRA